MALGHGVVRVSAALANSTLVLYVYIGHMWGFELSSFCSAGNPRRLVDYLRQGEIDPVFDYLRPFTFSDAMLQNLNAFMLIGTPVAVVYFILECRRIRWLQTLVRQLAPSEDGKRASSWLEAYLWTVSASFFFVLMLAYFHIEMPRGHYIVAGCAFSCCLASICMYLYATFDLSALVDKTVENDIMNGSSKFDYSSWASRVQTWVRPTLKCVVLLHVAAMVAGIWKIQRLEDKRAALLFGVLETAVIFGYQVFLAAFAVDDVMIGKTMPSVAEKLTSS
jgi:hypothetical protein